MLMNAVLFLVLDNTDLQHIGRNSGCFLSSVQLPKRERLSKLNLYNADDFWLAASFALF